MENVNEKMAVFKQIENEVHELDGYINKELKDIVENPEDTLYTGVQIYFSPIKINPDVMFLGINPGAGWHDEHGRNVTLEDTMPEKFESIEYYYKNYQLAKQWKKIFSSPIMNHPNEDGVMKYNRVETVLKNAFKTNYYYFATPSENHLDGLIDLLAKYGKDLNDLSAKWTKQMILAVNPKILICEGFKAFDNLKKCFGTGFEFKEEETNQNDSNCIKCGRIGKIVVLGVSRNRSTISNYAKELIAKKLDEYL